MRTSGLERKLKVLVSYNVDSFYLVLRDHYDFSKKFKLRKKREYCSLKT